MRSHRLLDAAGKGVGRAGWAPVCAPPKSWPATHVCLLQGDSVVPAHGLHRPRSGPDAVQRLLGAGGAPAVGVCQWECFFLVFSSVFKSGPKADAVRPAPQRPAPACACMHARTSAPRSATRLVPVQRPPDAAGCPVVRAQGYKYSSLFTGAGLHRYILDRLNKVGGGAAGPRARHVRGCGPCMRCEGLAFRTVAARRPHPPCSCPRVHARAAAAAGIGRSIA